MISRRLTTDIPGAARMLGISDRVAYDHARVGTLPGCFRLGGKGGVPACLGGVSRQRRKTGLDRGRQAPGPLRARVKAARWLPRGARFDQRGGWRDEVKLYGNGRSLASV